MRAGARGRALRACFAAARGLPRWLRHQGSLMPVALPYLDYSFDALEPHISGATLKTHHSKHHKAYVDKTNALIAGTPLAGASLEEIVRHAAQRRSSEKPMAKLF